MARFQRVGHSFIMGTYFKNEIVTQSENVTAISTDIEKESKARSLHSTWSFLCRKVEVATFWPTLKVIAPHRKQL